MDICLVNWNLFMNVYIFNPCSFSIIENINDIYNTYIVENRLMIDLVRWDETTMELL